MMNLILGVAPGGGPLGGHFVLCLFQCDGPDTQAWKVLMRRPAIDFDATLKDLFQHQHPTLLRRLTGGVPVKEFLNVELPTVRQRRVDLLLLLADETLLHIEFQSRNDANMPYRMLEYWWLIKARYRQPLRQVVLFVGTGRAMARTGFEEDGLRFDYATLDLREIESPELIRTGNRADLALAILGRGSEKHLGRIVRRAAAVQGPERDRLLAQILLLSGLRGMSGKVEWTIKHMGVTMDITKHPVLMRWRREWLAEGESKGKAEGAAEGRVRGMSRLLHEQMEIKFGVLPKWAEVRMAKASSSQMERWGRKILTATTLEGVIGPRRHAGS